MARRKGASGHPRQDWRKLVMYAFSLTIVLSMVLSLFAAFLQ